MNLKDLVLLGVVVFSMLAGALAPALGNPFLPCLTYFMIVFLFLSFLRVGLVAVIRSAKDVQLITILLLVKLLAIPLCLYYLTKLFLPSYALSVLLLSGISTGVVAPPFKPLYGHRLYPPVRARAGGSTGRWYQHDLSQ